jgi:hypothetical protein
MRMTWHAALLTHLSAPFQAGTRIDGPPCEQTELTTLQKAWDTTAQGCQAYHGCAVRSLLLVAPSRLLERICQGGRSSTRSVRCPRQQVGRTDSGKVEGPVCGFKTARQAKLLVLCNSRIRLLASMLLAALWLPLVER